MMQKQREPLRRPRPRSRYSREKALVQQEPSTLEAARAVACRFVANHWPELANVQPAISTRQHHTPDPAMLARLGLEPNEVVLRRPGVEYTFTFAVNEATVDGAVHPHVAAVTVDAEQQVVKTTISR
jgi:hypothetical protein